MKPPHITAHAAERFCDRFAPGMNWAEATEWLRAQCETAEVLPYKTVLGQHQWRIQDPPCVLVIKHDPHVGPVAVTVLRDPERFTSRPTASEQEIVKEWLERVPIVTRMPDEKYIEGVFKNKAKGLRPSKVHLAPEAKTVKASKNLEAMRDMVVAKQKEKTKRHLANNERTIMRLKRALRATVRVLLHRAQAGDEQAMDALLCVQEADPGFLTEPFFGRTKTEK